jgi:hypothetical protein
MTCRVDEAYTPECLAPTPGKGIMFWGSFAGKTKDPSILWDKSWGKINAENYCQQIIPLIAGYMIQNPDHFFMQDNAPVHAAQHTASVLREHGISATEWPLNGRQTRRI